MPDVSFSDAVSHRGVSGRGATGRLLLEGVGDDWADHIYTMAWSRAYDTRVPQAFWYCETVDCYGSTPLPEWLEKHASRASLTLIEIVQPD